MLTKVGGKFFPAYLIVEKSSFNFKYFDYNYKILNDTLESLKKFSDDFVVAEDRHKILDGTR